MAVMTETAIPATFMRGGTSKGLMVLRADLPMKREDWAEILAGAMGSPDVHERQLNGMGGGLSSLSKVCIVEPSEREDADVDFTFAQVGIATSGVDYSTNCGNMASAVGPFAMDRGLVPANDGEARVRIFNTNTRKLIHATFLVREGRAILDGDFAIPGVSGTGAPIRLDFVEPGGATTGRLTPTGLVRDVLTDPVTGSRLDVSLIDAANACVFVLAEQLGLSGAESPEALARADGLLARLAAIRAQASVMMGIAGDPASASAHSGAPFLAMVSGPQAYAPSSGPTIERHGHDLTLRVISHGQPHRAVPLTVALCSGVAARLPGSVLDLCWTGPRPDDGSLRLGTPSGVLTVAADVARGAEGEWTARSGAFYRTARRLFEGRVWSRT